MTIGKKKVKNNNNNSNKIQHLQVDAYKIQILVYVITKVKALYGFNYKKLIVLADILTTCIKLYTWLSEYSRDMYTYMYIYFFF